MKTATKNAALAAAVRNDPRWASIVARDVSADGKFYYSVKTAGVYCRPSCAARLARPENIGFHATREDAEKAGFRPCKRCRPNQPTLLPGRGKAIDILFAVGECTLGAVLVAKSGRGVCAILLGDDPARLVRDLQDKFPNANLTGGEKVLETLVAKVVELVEHPELGLDLPLDIRGTAFQQRVWKALREIPPGTTATYAQVASRIGSPKSVRAVAQACGANRIAVAIPCHRVVRTGGALSGYRWGVERKRLLLAREGQAG